MSGLPQITLEDGLTALREVGCRPTDDHAAWLCPRCRVAELTIAQNGAGPHFDCAGECGDLGAYLATTRSTACPAAAPTGDHVDEIEVVRDKLKLPELERIVKDGRLGDHYSFVLTDGRSVAIGPVSTLTSQAKFRNAFLPQMRAAGATLQGVRLGRRRRADRESRRRAGHDRHSRRGGDGLDRRLGCRRRGPPRSTSPTSRRSGTCSPARRRAFRTTDGRLYLRIDELKQWIDRHLNERVTQQELSLRLARLGFTRPDDGGQVTAYRAGEKKRQSRYWISPPDFEATR